MKKSQCLLPSQDKTGLTKALVLCLYAQGTDTKVTPVDQ